MKKLLTAYIALSFVTVAVFGFIGMGNMCCGHVDDQVSCVADIARNSCPVSSSGNEAGLHLGIYKYFSTATFTSDTDFTPLLSVLLMLALITGLFRAIEAKLASFLTPGLEPPPTLNNWLPDSLFKLRSFYETTQRRSTLNTI